MNSIYLVQVEFPIGDQKRRTSFALKSHYDFCKFQTYLERVGGKVIRHHVEPVGEWFDAFDAVESQIEKAGALA